MTNEYNQSHEISNYGLMKNLAAPPSIAFDVTSNCNLRCVHCFNNSGESMCSNDLTSEEKLNVARQIAEMHPFSVCLCGGEALCCENLIEIAKIIGPNVGSLNMVSNGFALTEKKIIELQKCQMKFVQISLDGVNPWQHDTFSGVSGSFDKAVNAIKLLKKCKMDTIATSFVPNILNYKSFIEYSDLCFEVGVDIIRIMPFIPSGRGENVGRKLIPSNSQYFRLQRSICESQTKYDGKMKIEWGDPLDHMRRMPANAQQGLNTYTMEIKSNGNLTVTTYLPIIVGNVRLHTLQEYWDAGYNYIWKNKDVLKHIEKIQNIYDFEHFVPAPYSGEYITVDIL